MALYINLKAHVTGPERFECSQIICVVFNEPVRPSTFWRDIKEHYTCIIGEHCTLGINEHTAVVAAFELLVLNIRNIRGAVKAEQFKVFPVFQSKFLHPFTYRETPAIISYRKLKVEQYSPVESKVCSVINGTIYLLTSINPLLFIP